MAYIITIKQGNLLDAPDAAFIVNPSKTRLVLGSGVSGAFARACGETLQMAMNAKLVETGRLSKGDVVATLPGECTRFRTVLHAAVMDYNPGAAETMPNLGTIRKILENIKRIVSDETVKIGRQVKLVLPMMGTGVGGLDKQSVLKIYREFFVEESGPDCEIVLYAHSESDRIMMEKLFET